MKMESNYGSDTSLMSGDRLRLEIWALERHIPSARNARTHSEAQVAEIAGSIRAFGFPIQYWLERTVAWWLATAGSRPHASLASMKFR